MVVDDERVCDNCKEDAPEYFHSGAELCSDCAEGAGWLDALNDY